MRRVWCHVVLVAIHLVFVVIGLACAAKLLDLPRFEAALDAYDRVPEALRQAALVTVPIVEGALAILWFARIRTRLIAGVTATFLVVVSLVIAWQWWQGDAPPCGCFGRLAAHAAWMEDAAWTLGRNTLMVVAALTYTAGNTRTTGQALR